MFANDFFYLQNLADILLEIIVDVDFRLLLTFFFFNDVDFVRNKRHFSFFFNQFNVLHCTLPFLKAFK